MGRPVELTWYDEEGDLCVENLTLASDEDRLEDLANHLTPYVWTSKGEKVYTVGEMAEGKVVFADDVGIFDVVPEKIVHIKMLEDE